MKVIVGLGNPGKKYELTRHNLGFILLDRFADGNNADWQFDKKFNSFTQVISVGSEKYLLIKPLTHMNLSGSAVRSVLDYYKLTPSDLLVIHDDVDLPFGEYRVQFGRGSAGHRGVQDIIDKLGTNEFWRLRFGVGKPDDTSNGVDIWVLANFSPKELSHIEKFGDTILDKGILSQLN